MFDAQGRNLRPASGGKFLCFRGGGRRFLKETSVRNAWARFGARGPRRSPQIDEDSTTRLVWRSEGPARAQYRVIYRAPEAWRACVRNERLAVDRRGSGGTLQTQGAPLIGEAWREIHEACDAVAPWEGA
jgi:hypothetical protein